MNERANPKEIPLRINSNLVFINLYEFSENAPNIVFIITPIASVADPLVKPFMENLINQKCNLFTMDLPGIGQSDGDASVISYKNMRKAVLVLTKYITENYTGKIHFYGGTGTGGIIGQALCSDPEIHPQIASFIQYGVGIYGDLSFMGNSRLLKLSYPIIAILNYIYPKGKLKFKIPKYKGYNADKENDWYQAMMKQKPGAFDFSYALIYTLLKLFISKRSVLKNKLKCPTLVIAAKHDRYFSEPYIEKYYRMLDVPKKKYLVENSHLAFYWNEKEIHEEVIKWVTQDDYSN